MGTYEKCKNTLINYIDSVADIDGTFELKQHKVANDFNLNSGVVSQVLRKMINDQQISIVRQHHSRTPALYKVCNV